MASTAKLQEKSGNGAAPGATTEIRSPVANRLARLRALAAEDPAAARADAWAWIAEAGKRINSGYRGDALAELGELFRAGEPSRGIDGPTEGAVVGFTTQSGVDRALAGLTSLWLPWAGKSFDAAASRGENLLLKSARYPARVLWPLYSMRAEGDDIHAFDFTTYVEAGALDPDRQVLVIDYASVPDNPRLLIKSIRDELVEIVPGAHLGKMLWIRGGGEKHTLLAYFALKSQI